MTTQTQTSPTAVDVSRPEQWRLWLTEEYDPDAAEQTLVMLNELLGVLEATGIRFLPSQVTPRHAPRVVAAMREVAGALEHMAREIEVTAWPADDEESDAR